MDSATIAFIATLVMLSTLAFILVSLHQDEIVHEGRVPQIIFSGKGRLFSINFGGNANYYPYSTEMDFDGELTFRFDKPVDPHSIHAMFVSDGDVTCDTAGVRVTVVSKG